MLPFASLFHHLYLGSHPETHRMGRSLRCALFLLAGLPALLGAQGFGIYEQGTCSMGRAGTGVAAPCSDGSAVFFNPAGLAGLKGGRATIGLTLLDVQGGFTDDIFQQKSSLDDPLIPIPQVYAAYGVTPKLGVGIGLFAPYGLETVPVPPGSPPVLFGQFGIAPGTDFADAHLEASKTTVTAHWGGIIKVNDKVSIGGRYLMKATFDYSGTAQFSQVLTNLVIPATITVGTFTIPAGTPVDALLAAPVTSGGLDLFNTVLVKQAVTTQITNPEQLILGLAYKPRKDWTLFADYQFTRWGKRFYQLDINFANPVLNRVLYERYQNTSGFRFAGEWAKDAKWTLRGGYLYHQGAAPPETVTPLLPEGNRNEFTGGFTVKLSPGFSADVAYQYIKQNDRRGRTREPLFNQVATTGMNNGLYTFHAHLFGVSLGYAF